MSTLWRNWITGSTPAQDPAGIEDAWRMLEQVLSLVRHAEVKAVTTLATSGVLGQILLVVPGERGSGAAVCHVVSGIFAIVAGVCSIGVLWPRTRYRGSKTNLLHFGTVARIPGRALVTYQRQLADLVRDRDELLAQVAAQVWANSIVAQRKFRLANLAVTSLLVASITLGGALATMV